MLGSTLSPVKRDRESNRNIPQLYAYVNNYLHKKCIAEGDNFYSTFGIQKFGHWLGENKKHTH